MRGRSVTPIPPAAIGDRRRLPRYKNEIRRCRPFSRGRRAGSENKTPLTRKKIDATTIFHAGDSLYRLGTRALFARTVNGSDVLMLV